MKRYYIAENVVECTDGTWIKYEDHVEAMKRIAAAPVAQGREITDPQIREQFILEGGWQDDHTADWEISGKGLIRAVRALLAASPADQGEDATAGARDVLAERRRQVESEGWTPEHDDEHGNGEMAVAAACYMLADTVNYPPAECPDMWPWAPEWWKPADDRRNLVKAGALILAEIDRIDRAAISASKEGA